MLGPTRFDTPPQHNGCGEDDSIAVSFWSVVKGVCRMTLVEKQPEPPFVGSVPDGEKNEGQAAVHADIRRRIESLTPRERQVLELLVKGLRGKEIGARLGVSLRTVDVHRASVLRKMGAGSLAQLGWQVAVSGLMGDSMRMDSGHNWEDRNT